MKFLPLITIVMGAVLSLSFPVAEVDHVRRRSSLCISRSVPVTQRG